MAKKIENVGVSGKKQGKEINLSLPQEGKRSGVELSNPNPEVKKQGTSLKSFQVENPKK